MPLRNFLDKSQNQCGDKTQYSSIKLENPEEQDVNVGFPQRYATQNRRGGYISSGKKFKYCDQLEKVQFGDNTR